MYHNYNDTKRAKRVHYSIIVIIINHLVNHLMVFLTLKAKTTLKYVSYNKLGKIINDE